MHHSIQRIGTSIGNGFALFPTLMLMCGKVSKKNFVKLTAAALFRLPLPGTVDFEKSSGINLKKCLQLAIIAFVSFRKFSEVENMQDVIDRVYDTLTQNGWTISKQDIYSHNLPECVSSRYYSLPEEWVEFLNSIRVCVNPDETAWFLCMDDFSEQSDNAFSWNEFELMSLQAAIDDRDTEWQSSIVKFWDNHLPVCLSVADGYGYYAIRMSDGFIVHGSEPEFEETTDVAPSFARFMEMVCAGECIL